MDNHRVATHYAKAAQDQEWEELGVLMHDEFVARYPQSGETFRGRDAYVTMLANFPAGLGEADFSSVKGGADAIVTPPSQPFLSPTVTVFGGDRFVIEGVANYADGSVWNFVSILRIQQRRVIEDTSYFAEPFDPPDWRKDYREPQPT